tara:strand:- start:1489 stop:2910 length:1422 start_codon:yes stop_codon:yes gene_type:complete
MEDYFKFAYSTASVKKIEQQIISEGTEGFSLMMKAAQVACKHLLSRSADQIIILCGKGNNGGDGYGLAALLSMANLKVDVFEVGLSTTPEAKLARKLCTNLGIRIERWNGNPRTGKWYVDALLGSGISRKPEGLYRNAIEFLNLEKCNGKNILSLDIPSGLNGSTGEGYGLVVQASETITFLAMKKGLLTGSAVDYTGQITFNNLGVEKYSETADAQILKEEDCDLGLLKPSAHKGDRGNVIVLGGIQGMEGAGILAGLAALKAGAGKVYWITNTRSLQRPPELITVEPKADTVSKLLSACRVCVLGPGLGLGLEDLIKPIWQSSMPIVLDADGLRWLAKELPPKRVGKLIGTPHPGEAKHLVGSKRMDRFETIEYLKEYFGGEWVLKGAGTLIHESQKLWINNLNSPQLGTAGSGDVLAGLIAGLWSVGSESPARTGVWLHSHFASEALKAQSAPFLTATDLLKQKKNSEIS